MGISNNSFLLQIAAKINLFVVSQNLSSTQLWLRLWNISTSALILIFSLLFITKRVNRGAPMKRFILIYITVFVWSIGFAQEYDEQRIQTIQNQLTALTIDIEGLDERIDITMQQASLATFLVAISEVHNINIDANPQLQNIRIINNFKDVTVADVLLYLCKTYDLSIDFTGTILYIKLYDEPVEEPEERVIPISFDPTTQNLTLELKSDNLSEAFTLIADQSGKGLFFTPDLGNQNISVFIKDLPFDIAMEKLAYSNNILVTKTKDGTYEFEAFQPSANNTTGGTISRPARPRRASFFFEINDSAARLLNVDFENVAIADIVYDIGNALELNIFTASPLSTAGIASVKAKNISFDELLTKIFENHRLSGTNHKSNSGNNNGSRGNQANATPQDRFTYKKENDVYYFGTYQQLTLRSAEVIPLRYRSLGLLSDPQSSGRQAGRPTSAFGASPNLVGFGNQSNNNQNGRGNSSGQNSGANTVEADLSALIPEDIKQDLNIIADKELNSFIVSGASSDIDRFRSFIEEIDRQVPIVIVEVMILEISKNATIDAGIEWGIGTEPTQTQGNLFPNTDIILGAETVNRILGRIGGSSFFNVGQVGSNFFARLHASETNGDFKIKSSPRITTLNGHRAYFSNGQTSYFEVRQSSFIGTQNPTISESSYFQAIDAELSLDVLPFVSADGEVTMDLRVIQSSFSGERISENGPPEISSREFTSIIKARNNDIIVLGGLEEQVDNDSGSGVPFLAKVPIIKWLFSKRTRTATKSKLTVLIKPTILY